TSPIPASLTLPPYPPSDAVPAGRLVTSVAKDVGRSVARLVARRSRRDRQRVADEYDTGTWQARSEAERWLQSADLESFLVGDAAQPQLLKLNGRARIADATSYYRWRIAALNSIVGQAAGDTDSVVEVGCGFGFNLLSLSLANRFQEMLGLDISPTGIA